MNRKLIPTAAYENIQLDYICMNNDGFDGLRRPRHILMELIANRGGKVLFVSSALDYFSQREKKNFLRWGGIRKIQPNLLWFQPPALLRNYYSIPWLHAISKYTRVALVQIISKIIRLKQPILFVATPDADFRAIIRKFPGSIIIYNLHDRFLDQSNHWIDGHFEMLRYADIVLCGSTFLLDEVKNETNGKAYLFPPALDTNVFPRNDLQALLKKNSNLDKPVVGYVGNLGNQLDWELLDHLTDHTEFKFVFIGPISTAASGNNATNRIMQKPNVSFEGRVNHNEIPDKILSFDVCILPYQLNEYSKGINPLKILEYLALGKPVICSPIPSADSFSNIILIAETYAEWLGHIKQSLNENNEENIKNRVDFAYNQNYENRLNFINFLISEYQSRKNNITPI